MGICLGISIQPEFQFNQRTTLSIGDIDVSYLWRHIDSVEVEPLVAGNFLEDFRRIGSADYFDLAVRAELGEHMTFTFTVSNLFDKQPPIVGNTIGSTAFNSGNTYPSTYDAIGRRYSAAVRLRF